MDNHLMAENVARTQHDVNQDLAKSAKKDENLVMVGVTQTT